MAEYDGGADTAPQQQEQYPPQDQQQQYPPQQQQQGGGDSSEPENPLAKLLTIIGAIVAAVGYIIEAASFVANNSAPAVEWTLFVFLAPVFLLLLRKSGEGKDVIRPFCSAFAVGMGIAAFFGAVADARNNGSNAQRAEAAGGFILFLGEIALGVASFFF